MNTILKLVGILVVILINSVFVTNAQAQVWRTLLGIFAAERAGEMWQDINGNQRLYGAYQGFMNPPSTRGDSLIPVDSINGIDGGMEAKRERQKISDKAEAIRTEDEMVQSQAALREIEIRSAGRMTRMNSELNNIRAEEEGKTEVHDTRLEAARQEGRMRTETIKQGIQGRLQLSQVLNEEQRKRLGTMYGREMHESQARIVQLMEEYENYLDKAFVESAKILLMEFEFQQKGLRKLVDQCAEERSVILDRSRRTASARELESGKLHRYKDVARALNLPNYRGDVGELSEIRRHNGIDYIVGDIYDAIDRQRETLKTIEYQTKGSHEEMDFYETVDVVLRGYLPELDKWIGELKRWVAQAQIYQQMEDESPSEESQKIIATIRNNILKLSTRIANGPMQGFDSKTQTKGIYD